MLAISRTGKLHLVKYLPKAREFTTICDRGWVVERPLWKFPNVTDNKHVNLPSCHWCQRRSKSNVANKIYHHNLLNGMKWNRAYNLAHGIEE